MGSKSPMNRCEIGALPWPHVMKTSNPLCFTHWIDRFIHPKGSVEVLCGGINGSLVVAYVP